GEEEAKCDFAPEPPAGSRRAARRLRRRRVSGGAGSLQPAPLDLGGSGDDEEPDAVAHHRAPARDPRLLTVELDLSLLLVDPVLQLAVRRSSSLEADHDERLLAEPDLFGRLVQGGRDLPLAR